MGGAPGALPPGECAKAEMKAMMAFSVKAGLGHRVARESVVRYGCSCAPGDFWPEAVAAIGSEFDLLSASRDPAAMSDGRTPMVRGQGHRKRNSNQHSDLNRFRAPVSLWMKAISLTDCGARVRKG